VIVAVLLLGLMMTYCTSNRRPGHAMMARDMAQNSPNYRSLDASGGKGRRRGHPTQGKYSAENQDRSHNAPPYQH